MHVHKKAYMHRAYISATTKAAAATAATTTPDLVEWILDQRSRPRTASRLLARGVVDVRCLPHSILRRHTSHMGRRKRQRKTGEKALYSETALQVNSNRAGARHIAVLRQLHQVSGQRHKLPTVSLTSSSSQSSGFEAVGSAMVRGASSSQSTGFVAFSSITF